MMLTHAFFCFLLFVTIACAVGAHLNCLDFSKQFKLEPTKYTFKKKYGKKYTGCDLKSTKLLDCSFKGLCVNYANMVIRPENNNAFTLSLHI